MAAQLYSSSFVHLGGKFALISKTSKKNDQLACFFSKTVKKGPNGPKSSKMLTSAKSLAPYDHL
jgi:hypothetical protein